MNRSAWCSLAMAVRVSSGMKVSSSRVKMTSAPIRVSSSRPRRSATSSTRSDRIGLVLVGDGSTGFQRDEGVIVASEDDVSSHPSLEQPAQAQRHIQHQVLLHQAVRADGPSIVTAMPGVNHDAANLETEGASKAAFPG